MIRTLLAAIVALILLPAMALAQGGYNIRPGDTLALEVVEDPGLNRQLLVLPDGTVSIPLVGTVTAAGQTLDELQATIVAGLTPNFATSPTVFLSVSALNEDRLGAGRAADATPALRPPRGGIWVFAVGEVANPGRLDVAKGTTLLQFLAQSGLTRFAATKRIQLRRVDPASGQETVYKFNYRAVQDGGQAPTIVLKPGDVIVVPERRLFE